MAASPGPRHKTNGSSSSKSRVTPKRGATSSTPDPPTKRARLTGPGVQSPGVHERTWSWVESLRSRRRQSDTCLYVTRDRARLTSDMGNQQDSFGVPPTPDSQFSSFATDNQSATGSGPRSGRSLVGEPGYRQINLATNRISLRSPLEPYPAHITALVEAVRKDRNSPEPLPEDAQDELYKISSGAAESDVQGYFEKHLFPDFRKGPLRRCSKQPMARNAVPQSSKHRISTPIPDLLYGHPVCHPELVSMGTKLWATNQTEGLVVPFFLVEFRR